MEFLLWRNETRDGFCTIRTPSVERIWELVQGIPRAQDFPDGMECRMDPQRPKDVGLADNVRGAVFPVISGRLKQALEPATEKNRVEYIPVRIINHKKRLASDDYFVLNPLDVLDCIDMDASGVEWNKISPTTISYCKGLVLKQEAIPAGFALFRLKYWPNNIVISGDLVANLRQLELTGLVFRNATGYDGLG